MQFNELIREVRALPAHAIEFTANWWVKERFAEFEILKTSECAFNLDTFAAYGNCTLTLSGKIHPDIDTSWNSDRNERNTSIEHGVIDVDWNSHAIKILRLTWQDDFTRRQVQWLLGDSQDLLRQFFETVCRWQPNYEPMVEVFEDGHWSRSLVLHQAIRSATLDNLILAPGLKEELRMDLSHFFGSRDIYDRYRIPWKRGVLLSGPPGNGKTHAVKALINWLNHPALYVKSLKSRRYTEHQLMHSVFSRARLVTPCILVLEDLESIVTPSNRSYFLNELDGFALNTGILVLASTNHPERLDPALTERPSRFDRKYNFDLPALSERARYLEAWNEAIEEDLKLSNRGVATVAAETEGFSFAFLKELLMASMMRWINLPEKLTMDVVMAAQAQVLRTQLSSASTPAPELLTDFEEEENED